MDFRRLGRAGRRPCLEAVDDAELHEGVEPIADALPPGAKGAAESSNAELFGRAGGKQVDEPAHRVRLSHRGDRRNVLDDDAIEVAVVPSNWNQSLDSVLLPASRGPTTLTMRHARSAAVTGAAKWR